MEKIGVLALQGAVAEHIRAIEKSGAIGIAVKKVDQLQDLDGIIIPGGESTTIGKLINQYGFQAALLDFHHSGKPIFGTCAGMIILAKKIEGQDTSHLGLMDIRVERNAFGRQRESFEAELVIPGIANDFVAVFIRAPYVIDVFGEAVILSKYNERIVMVQQGTLLATSFHPELTEDTRVHEHFVEMVKSAKHKRLLAQ